MAKTSICLIIEKSNCEYVRCDNPSKKFTISLKKYRNMSKYVKSWEGRAVTPAHVRYGLSFLICLLLLLLLFRGVARIFQSGAHTVSNNIVMAFSPRNIVGCLQRGGGGSRAPLEPPRYALVVVVVVVVVDNKQLQLGNFTRIDICFNGRLF